MSAPVHVLMLAGVAGAMVPLALGLGEGLTRRDARLAAAAGVEPATSRARAFAEASWLRLTGAHRRRRSREQLPLALMLIATALRSGLGLVQALQLVGREGPREIARDFARVADDLALGLDLEQAIERLRVRLGSTEADMFATAVLVQRQTGGNLAELLAGLHDAIRERQQLAAQVRTLTAMGRMSGAILSLLPVVLVFLISLANAQYLSPLLADPRGRVMSMLAAGFMLGGVAAIRRIVRVDV